MAEGDRREGEREEKGAEKTGTIAMGIGERARRGDRARSGREWGLRGFTFYSLFRRLVANLRFSARKLFSQFSQSWMCKKPQPDSIQMELRVGDACALADLRKRRRYVYTDSKRKWEREVERKIRHKELKKERTVYSRARVKKAHQFSKAENKQSVY